MLRTKMLVINVLRDSSQTSASAFFSRKFLLLGRAIHLLFYVFLPGSSGRWRLGNAVFDIVDIESGRTMDFLDEEKQKLSERALFVQKIYERKCLHPSKNDILNCIFELQSKGLMSLILQYWNEEDTTFGNQIRARFKQDFLEAAQIEALWKNETLEIILE